MLETFLAHATGKQKKRVLNGLVGSWAAAAGHMAGSHFVENSFALAVSSCSLCVTGIWGRTDERVGKGSEMGGGIQGVLGSIKMQCSSTGWLEDKCSRAANSCG